MLRNSLETCLQLEAAPPFSKSFPFYFQDPVVLQVYLWKRKKNNDFEMSIYIYIGRFANS